MFSPDPNINVSALWDILGTFYGKLDKESKERIEAFWTALFEGTEGLTYDLYQSNLTQYLDLSRGYIEHGHQIYDIIFEGDEKNTINMISGLHYYKLPGDNMYLSIPELSGINTGQVLQEGTDYEIHNLHYLKFLTDVNSYENNGNEYTTANSGINLDTNQMPGNYGESYYSVEGISLVPSLTGVFFSAFGDPNPEKIILSGRYEPFVSGWHEENKNYLEKKKEWALHLTKLTQAMYSTSKKHPTLKNLQNLYSLILGVPFSYESGVVTNLTSNSSNNYITISGLTGDIVYEVTSDSHFSPSVGDTVDKFSSLVSGVSMYDYSSDPSMISGILTRNGDTFKVTTSLKEAGDDGYYDGGKNQFSINGEKRKSISLVRRKRYKFEVESNNHAFYFSSDVRGGYPLRDEENRLVENGKSEVGNVFFTPLKDTPCTVYYLCAYHENEGGKVNIIDDESRYLGDVSNPQEFYHTLGIQVTNRVKDVFKGHKLFIDKFLTDRVPPGLKANVFNLPPEVVTYSDYEWYDPTSSSANILLSGLVSDPEDDILNYKWELVEPIESYGGSDLGVTIANDTNLESSAIVSNVPPTNRLYKFKLTTYDSDNSVETEHLVKVSGTSEWTTWGEDGWTLWDAELPYEDLP